LLPVATRRQAFRRPHSRPAHIATASLSATIACDPATPPRLPLSQWYLSLSLPLFPLAAPQRSLFFAAGCTHNSLLSTRLRITLHLRFTLHFRLLSALLHSPLRSLSAYSPLYFTLRSGHSLLTLRSTSLSAPALSTLPLAAPTTRSSQHASASLSTSAYSPLYFTLYSGHSLLRVTLHRHSPLLRPRTTRLSYNAPR
jgi:hypothetical protein